MSEAAKRPALERIEPFVVAQAQYIDALRALCRDNERLAAALEQLIAIIDAAGLINLSNGVQLGQTSWYVKASDRLDFARAVLAESTLPADRKE